MIDRQASVSALLSRLRSAHPSGFAIALHLRFTAPKYLFQAYDSKWIGLYTRLGLVLSDPTVRWGMANTGAIRWSGINLRDPAGVMRLAAEHGLRYGITVAVEQEGTRSIGSFARSDREATDAEIDEAAGELAELHRLTAGIERLTPRFHDELKQMSVFLSRG